MNDWTKVPLDAAQQRGVDHSGSPLLISGSAGTGKTTVLLRRWLRLASTEVKAHRVLMLVTSRRQAVELRQDLPWRLDSSALIEVPVHTWHALGYHLVTRYHRMLGYSQAPVLLTATEQFATVRSLLATEEAAAWGDYGPQLSTSVFASEVADFVARAGHRCVSDEDLHQIAADRPDTTQVVNFAVRYRRHLASIHALDHAGLISSAAGLLSDHPEIAEGVARRFTHVLVDDAQDLAPAQIQLLTHLRTDNLVCAGDPDSAVEAFRGADPRWLDRFGDAIGAHESLVLETTHRHGPQIGAVVSKLISHGRESSHRTSDFKGPDGSAQLKCMPTLAAEVQSVARALKAAHLDSGLAFSEMAVIVTQPSVYLTPLQRALDTLGVPHQSAGDTRRLHEAPAVRWMLDLIRAALDSDPDKDLVASVLASPIVGMAIPAVRDLLRSAYRSGTSVVEASANTAEAAEFHRLRRVIGADPLAGADEAFQRVFEASVWCREQVRNRTEDRQAADHVEALAGLAQALGHMAERDPNATLQTYLDEASTSEAVGPTWSPPGAQNHGVTILTPHASRGREWDFVCIMGVAEGHIPRSQKTQGLFDPWALQDTSAVKRATDQLDEERRMLYIAMSRARRELRVSVSPGRGRLTPSRFLNESFGEVPEAEIAEVADQALTLSELTGSLRRTLASEDATLADKKAAAAALAAIPGVEPSKWWWRRDFTSGQPLYPDGKLVTSYSRIGKFDNCPLQYVLESVLGLDPSGTYQMEFGSLIHHIFEHAEPNGGSIQTIEQALDVYKKQFVEKHRHDYPNVVFARTYYRAGVQMIKRWWATERPRDTTVKVEFAFDDLDVDGHIVRGRIDRVSKNNAGVVLTDYKTARWAATKQEAKESLQLAIYWLAAQNYEELSQHGEPALMQLVYPGRAWRDYNTGQELCDRRTQKPEEAADAIENLRGILAKAAQEDFNPSPTADCQWCKMRPLCPRWPEGREIPV